MLNDLYHALDPVAISAGPITIYWYGLAYIFGAILTAIIMYRTQRRWGMDLTVDDLVTVVVGVVFGLIIGGRLSDVVFYGDGYYFGRIPGDLRGEPGRHELSRRAGGRRARRLDRVPPVSDVHPHRRDLAVTGAPIALFLGRCANFVNGELWGKPTDLPWGVVFETGGGVARHPFQLYEALLEGIVLLVVLQLLSRRKPVPPQGTFLGVFILGYGIARILVEFVRVPDAQLGYLFGGVVTMGQVLSLPLLAIGAGLIVWAHRANRPQRVYLDGGPVRQ